MLIQCSVRIGSVLLPVCSASLELEFEDCAAGAITCSRTVESAAPSWSILPRGLLAYVTTAVARQGMGIAGGT